MLVEKTNPLSEMGGYPPAFNDLVMPMSSTTSFMRVSFNPWRITVMSSTPSSFAPCFFAAINRSGFPIDRMASLKKRFSSLGALTNVAKLGWFKKDLVLST